MDRTTHTAGFGGILRIRCILGDIRILVGVTCERESERGRERERDEAPLALDILLSCALPRAEIASKSVTLSLGCHPMSLWYCLPWELWILLLFKNPYVVRSVVEWFLGFPGSESSPLASRVHVTGVPRS